MHLRRGHVLPGPCSRPDRRANSCVVPSNESTVLMIQAADTTAGVRPRSVVAGRQRWDVQVLLNRPRVGDLIEATLRNLPGVRIVKANPVTGRVLVLHDPSISSDAVSLHVRQTADRIVVPTVVAPFPVSTAEPRTAAPRRRRRSRLRILILAACGTAVAALAGSLIASPTVKLVAVLGATVIVVRRAWQRSTRTFAGGTPARPRRPLRTIVGPHRRRFYGAVSLSVLGAVLYMAAAASAFSLASVLITGPTALVAGLGIATLSGQVWFFGAAGLAFCALFAGAWYAGGIMWRDLAQRVQHEWRCDIYAHVQRAELGYLEGERTTRVARVLTSDVDQIGRFLANQANYLIRVGTTLALLVAVFLVFAPEIAWLAFLPVPIVAYLSFYYQEHVAPDLAIVGKDASLLGGQLVNNLQASATIKSFGAEDFEVDRIRRLSEAFGNSNRAVDVRTTGYGQAVLGLSMMGLVGVYLLGGHLVVGGVLLLGAYNTVIRLPQLFNFQLPGLGEAVEQYQKTIAALGRVLQLRDLPTERSQTGRSFDPLSIEGEIVLEAVRFGYAGRPLVLENLSLRIKAGNTTAIVGTTGAGKTTIAKLLLRFNDVESGRVLLDGVDIQELKLRDLRAAIGFVEQEPFLFDGTVGDNIKYGSFDADSARMVAAARLAEADGFIATLPDAYDTMVGERGVALSGGQRQRIALARAIVKNAPILILDEATSAIDNETETAIQHALAEFAQGRTMLVIAHRLSTIRHADWIYVLGDGGAVMEQGTHVELLGQAGLYARLWQLQIGETP